MSYFIKLLIVLFLTCLLSSCAQKGPSVHGDGGSAKWIDRGWMPYERYKLIIENLQLMDLPRKFFFDEFPDGDYGVSLKFQEKDCEKRRDGFYFSISLTRTEQYKAKDLIFGVSGNMEYLKKLGFVDDFEYLAGSGYQELSYATLDRFGKGHEMYAYLYSDEQYEIELDIKPIHGDEELMNCRFSLIVTYVVAADRKNKEKY